MWSLRNKERRKHLSCFNKAGEKGVTNGTTKMLLMKKEGNVQPADCRVARNLEIIFKKISEPEFCPWGLRLASRNNNMDLMINPMRIRVRLVIQLKVSRNNLTILCHPMCNCWRQLSKENKKWCWCHESENKTQNVSTVSKAYMSSTIVHMSRPWMPVSAPRQAPAHIILGISYTSYLSAILELLLLVFAFFCQYVSRYNLSCLNLKSDFLILFLQSSKLKLVGLFPLTRGKRVSEALAFESTSRGTG